MLDGIVIGASAVAAIWWQMENRRRVRRPVPSGFQAEIQFPHREPFELYHNPLSLCSMKTRVCLHELGIDYLSHPIDLIETGAYENIRPEFLKINPAGTLPVLLHNGHPVYESHEQIRYAAEHAPYGSVPLVPKDAALKEQMEQWIDRASLSNDPLAGLSLSAGNCVPGLTFPLFAAMMKYVPSTRLVEGLLFHFDKRRPVLFAALKGLGVRRFHWLKPAYEVYRQSVVAMRGHLSELEQTLKTQSGPWILGEQFTLADVSWMVIFERFRQADCLDLFLNAQTPASNRYWHALQQRPGYLRGIRDCGHPLIEAGTEQLAQAKRYHPSVCKTLSLAL